MKVSVVVPVYNVENYLKECVESLLAQTLEEIEICFVDDGSTDRSLEMLLEYEREYPEKIKVFHKKNGGQASARNLALKYIKGEYVGFVDSDDWVDKDMYECLYMTAQSENADIVICDMVDHYPDKIIYHHSSVFEDVFKVTPSACNKLFRREMLGVDNFPQGLWYEDFEFTTKQLMKASQISVVHKGFYHCHCRKESTMNNNNSKKNLDIITVMNHIEEFIIKKGWQEKYGCVLEYLVLDHILITSINRVARQRTKEKKEVIRQMRNYVNKKYPRFWKGNIFCSMKRNRRIIAWLNAHGLENISKSMLWIKERLSA